MLSQADMEKKRKTKEDNRREVKERRKNRVVESKKTAEITKPKEEKDIPVIDVSKMSFPEKVTTIKLLAEEILHNPEKNHDKLEELMKFTEDAKHFDIVLQALSHLHRVFIEIIPSYRIREEPFKNDKDKKLSKEVTQLRDYE